ncbi:MAG: hypothetical protein F6K54_05615 [Okeania sp. SIO3B5]|uniref:hypothetical protein n=1 Tax=Okeania sp. SIO3B5 TaxID=2607811 RepID=UPI0013FF67FF|nr:hypothetical protein [Okeania sp. SIO3B5]NEO52597.1 hypothetical protein [Okeania sp. SIO3B5]
MGEAKRRKALDKNYGKIPKQQLITDADYNFSKKSIQTLRLEHINKLWQQNSSIKRDALTSLNTLKTKRPYKINNNYISWDELANIIVYYTTIGAGRMNYLSIKKITDPVFMNNSHAHNSWCLTKAAPIYYVDNKLMTRYQNQPLTKEVKLFQNQQIPVENFILLFEKNHALSTGYGIGYADYCVVNCFLRGYENTSREYLKKQGEYVLRISDINENWEDQNDYDIMIQIAFFDTIGQNWCSCIKYRNYVLDERHELVSLTNSDRELIFKINNLVCHSLNIINNQAIPTKIDSERGSLEPILLPV